MGKAEYTPETSLFIQAIKNCTLCNFADIHPDDIGRKIVCHRIVHYL